MIQRLSFAITLFYVFFIMPMEEGYLEDQIASNWVEPITIEQHNNGFFEQWGKKFNKYFEYQPPEISEENKPYVIFFVHNEEDGDNDSLYTLSTQDFNALKVMVEHIANAKNTSVTLIFFAWQNSNDIKELLNQANEFKVIVDSIKNHNIITIADGLGGAIVKGACQSLESNNKIECMIFFNTPLLEATNTMFIPANYSHLLNFYSTKDILNQHWGYRKVGDLIKGNIHDIRTQIRGIDPNSYDLRTIALRYLPAIIQEISYYKYYRDLDLNIALELSKPEECIQLAIRKKKFLDSEIAEQTYSEIQRSNLKKEEFKALYDRDISDKGSILKRGLKATTSNILKFFTT